jgi:uncharacterized delta-60 repeat protein
MVLGRIIRVPGLSGGAPVPARFVRHVLAFALPIALVGSLVSARAATAAPGDLDPTFGSGGTVTTPIGSSSDEAAAVAIQADDKIVVAGSSFNGSNDDFALARYTISGALDATFGTGGKVTTAIGSSSDRAFAVAIQADGRIVVAGWSFTGSSVDFALARYTTSGALDGSFGTGGTVATPIGSAADFATAVAIQSDGMIVAAGLSQNASGDYEFALARYTTSGALDGTFGTGGTVTTAVGSSGDEANAVAIQSDGRIVVAGSSFGSTDDFALVRYTTSGALDGSFGTGGKVTTPIGPSSDQATAVAIQSDGKIVAAGLSLNASGDYDFALVRYTTSGALDGLFGTGGTVTTPIGSAEDIANAVAIQADGKIVAAGYSHSGSNHFALARYNPAGTLDGSFGTGGKVTTPIGVIDQAFGMAIQSDGKIVAAGSSQTSFNVDFALARYLADLPTISITDASLTEGDSGTTNMTFTVSLAGVGPSDRLTVHYSTASDTATSADYVPTDGTLTFTAGQTTKAINVSIKGDLVNEPDETFFVYLSSPAGATIGDGQGIGTIIDNDPAPAISINDPLVTEGNSGTSYATFVLSLSNPSAQYVTVDYDTADGTAVAPSDYKAKSGTRVFTPGQTTKTVSVVINGDTAQEPDETFVLNLVDPSNATIADGQGTATVTDDDRPTISISDVTKTEGNSGTTQTYGFKVTLSKAGTSTITVHYATANGTAVAPGDYTAKSGTLTFSVGQVSKTISVVVKGDNAVEPNEVFFVNLDSPTNATIADPQGVGTILNND